jgi:hypothetical protein
MWVVSCLVLFSYPLLSPGRIESRIDSEIWLGPVPENDVELQRSLKHDPPMLEIEFLKHAVEQASTVCYIELPQHNRQGTGFLIARDLILTNYLEVQMGTKLLHRTKLYAAVVLVLYALAALLQQRAPLHLQLLVFATASQPLP